MLVFCPSRRSCYVYFTQESYWEPQSFIHRSFVPVVGQVSHLNSATIADPPQRGMNVLNLEVTNDQKQRLVLELFLKSSIRSSFSCGRNSQISICDQPCALENVNSGSLE